MSGINLLGEKQGYGARSRLNSRLMKYSLIVIGVTIAGWGGLLVGGQLLSGNVSQTKRMVTEAEAAVSSYGGLGSKIEEAEMRLGLLRKVGVEKEVDVYQVFDELGRLLEEVGAEVIAGRYRKGELSYEVGFDTIAKLKGFDEELGRGFDDGSCRLKTLGPIVRSGDGGYKYGVEMVCERGS